MSKTGRKAGKRTLAAGRGRPRAAKSGAAKASRSGSRKPKTPKSEARKRKPPQASASARLKQELKAARLQQEASAEILRAVANASGDAAGPLQLIAETTARLFGASSVSIQLAEGSEFTQEYRVGAIAKRVGSANPRSNIKVGGRNLPGTVVAESRQIHIPDLDRLDPSMSDFPGLPHARAGGARTVCGTPLRREGKAIGALIVFRDRLLPFTDDELALQQSFADQAVIAIENARLFNEVRAKTRDIEESLQQQTATADVLKVISRSAFDLDAVMHTLAHSAAELCAAGLCGLYIREGNFLVCRGYTVINEDQEAFVRQTRIPADDPTYVVTRALLSGDITNIGDFDNYRLAATRVFQERFGFKSLLLVPLMREGHGIGVFVIGRDRVGEFSQRHIELVQTFADQAVIAIENVRLFDEVQAKTRDVEESLQQQTATADVLKVISRSVFDVQTVLDTLVESAYRLCGANLGLLYLKGDEAFECEAIAGLGVEDANRYFKGRPIGAGRATAAERVIMTGQVQSITDFFADPEFDPNAKEMIRNAANAGIGALRSTLGVPIMRDGTVIGVLVIASARTGTFPQRQIDLLRTFADQAVIAIENSRLFDELETKSRELGESLQQQTATAEVLQVTSNSPGELGPVFRTVLENATRICDARFGTLLRFDGNAFHFAADVGTPEALAEYMRRPGPIRGAAGGMIDRIQRTRQMQHSPDYATDAAPGLAARLGGARSTLGVPILRDDALVGAIVIYRQEVRPFSDREIDLVKSFAAQAAIAIENARLFNETREALERQTATSDILNVIASSPTDTRPVFEAIASRARSLVGGFSSTVFRFTDGQAHLEAFTPTTPEADEVLMSTFPRPVADFAPFRMTQSGEVMQIPDIESLTDEIKDIGRARGFRSMLFAPLMNKAVSIGFIGVTRVEPGRFAEHHVQLLRTFADQAVIAIGNTQLFDEVQARTRELARSLDDLRAAQDRLVQTEKLASLGQLTAGIAHEIKNPLNFVNNFSSLSAELVDELDDTLAPAPLDQKMRDDVGELTGMLKSNLEKVVQHGKRADLIVKNMLQHSRDGSGEHRSADINVIVEDSLNLAYHGARAEKSGFAITLRHDLDPEAGAAELYPQEITRALLNLISNGFYAATRRKADSGDESFEPVLSASTRNLGTTVEIRIRDNGTGVPPDVREKMFVPFFTTKPTGEGTGLGLSMTHDIIVKQHGGRIDVETEPGAFTEFIIILPRDNGSADR